MTDPVTVHGPVVSVVSAAFNEAENLPLLYDRLETVFRALAIEWEWIIVDDHSADDSFAVASALADSDGRVGVIRLARNFGTHTAFACGLHNVRGACCVVMAADMQDPPEVIPELLEKWREGAQVVWAVRGQRMGEKASTIWFSKLYYFLMRWIFGLREIPATGADFMLTDRTVVDAFTKFHEKNTSILALISWMGYRQVSVPYDKEARVHGRSGWTLRKKLRLLIDSITSFSSLPIRMMSYVGSIIALLGFIYAIALITNAISGDPIEGWTSLMVVVLTIGGIQMVMMGVLGEYLWRTLDESKRRPRYLIEERVGPNSADTEAQRTGRNPR